MSQTTYPRLGHMFGAFFHQDWDTEGADWPDLVRNFAQGQPAAELGATASELDRFLIDFPDDTALSNELFDVLYCSYDPRPDLGGPALRVWLDQIAGFLRHLAEQA